MSVFFGQLKRILLNNIPEIFQQDRKFLKPLNFIILQRLNIVQPENITLYMDVKLPFYLFKTVE